MTPDERVAMRRELIDLRAKDAAGEAELARLVAECVAARAALEAAWGGNAPTASPAAVQDVRVSATGGPGHGEQAVPAAAPRPSTPTGIARPAAIPPTPAAFPRAIASARPLSRAPPMQLTAAALVTQEERKELTSYGAVRSGAYAANRERLLGLLGGKGGPTAGHRHTGSGLLSLAAEQTPNGHHPMARSTLRQPKGHATTGPMSPLLAGKVARIRAAKGTP